MHKAIITLLLCLCVVSLLFQSTITYGRSTQEIKQASAITVPAMKLPWDKSTLVTFNSGPHSDPGQNQCHLQPISVLSGLDFGMSEGTKVLAVAAGTVVFAGTVDSQIRGAIVIDHGKGFFTEYWHLDSFDTRLINKYVDQGVIIGTSGYSPASDGSHSIHLHLEFRVGTFSGDPLTLTPYSANNLSIDRYRVWSLQDVASGQGYNYQGTMSQGSIVKNTTTYGAATGDSSAGCASQPVTQVTGKSGTWSAGDGKVLPSTNFIPKPKKWQITKSPTAEDRAAITGITGTSANDLWVVGNSYSGFSSHWNGSSWKNIPLPYDAAICGLAGIASSSSKKIIMVGWDIIASSPCILQGNGTSWTRVQDIEIPSGSNKNVLTSITMLPSGEAWAAGVSSMTGGSSQPLVYHYDPVMKLWSLSTIQGQQNEAQLQSIYAVSTNDVWAVGVQFSPVSGNQTVTLHYDSSHTWQYIPSPNGVTSGDNILFGVSGIASNDVWAVGYSFDPSLSSGAETLLLHWDGTMWKVLSSQNNGVDNTFYGVVATSSSQRWAVGDYYNSTLASHQTLIEKLDIVSGGIIVASPNDTDQNFLNNVALIAGIPIAVGYHVQVNTGGYSPSWPLIMQYE